MLELFKTRTKKETVSEQVSAPSQTFSTAIKQYNNETVVTDEYDMKNMIEFIQQNFNKISIPDVKFVQWKNEKWMLIASTSSDFGMSIYTFEHLQFLISVNHVAIRTERVSHITSNQTEEIISEHITANIGVMINILDSNKGRNGDISDIMIDRIDDILRPLHLKHAKNPTLNSILKCKNMEARQVWMKNIGFEKIKEYAKPVDNKNDYMLFDLKYHNIELGRFLKMKDSSTDREYLLRVPESKNIGGIIVNIDTVDEALAWSFDMPNGDYNPTKES